MRFVGVREAQVHLSGLVGKPIRVGFTVVVDFTYK
jgi:hypothetical protein